MRGPVTLTTRAERRIVAILLRGARRIAKREGVSVNSIADQGDNNLPPVSSWTATRTLQLLFTSGGANLVDLSAGEWELYICSSTLP